MTSGGDRTADNFAAFYVMSEEGSTVDLVPAVNPSTWGAVKAMFR